MAFYKIKNMTGSLGKRDKNKNKVLNIEFLNKFEKNTYTLGINDTIYLKLETIPLTLHQLRINGFINIIQISENEFNLYDKKIFIQKTPIKEIKKPLLKQKKVIGDSDSDDIINNETKKIAKKNNKS